MSKSKAKKPKLSTPKSKKTSKTKVHKRKAPDMGDLIAAIDTVDLDHNIKSDISRKAQELDREADAIRKRKERLLKQVEAYNGTKNILDESDVQDLTPSTQNYLAEQEVAWAPNSDIQRAFLASTEKEVLYAGGRGSGKSECMLVDPLRYVHHPLFWGLMIRRSMPDLQELIERAKFLYAKLEPGVKWNDQKKMFVFPSGAKIEFGYLDNKDDLLRYQGRQFTWLGIDELTQYPNEDMYEKLIGSVRSKIAGVPALIRATTNPSGPGVAWVKARFIEPERGQRIPPGARAEIKTILPSGEVRISYRKWFDSSVLDNKNLMESDPDYIAVLSSYSEDLKQRWLYGNWDTVEGAAFPEFDEKIHVVEPFKIPRHWTRFRSADWGYGSKAACLWFAVSPEDDIVVYRELITGNRTHRAVEFADAVLDLEMGENISYGVLDVSAWGERGEMTVSIADTMIEHGCDWMPSDRKKNSRSNHKMLVHDALAKSRDTGKPQMVIFNTCVDIINVLKTIQIDSKNNEDVNTKGDDHSYDALRYGLASRPSNGPEIRHLIQSVSPPIVINKITGM